MASVLLYMLCTAVLLFVGWRWWKAYCEAQRQLRQLHQRCRWMGAKLAKHNDEDFSMYWNCPTMRQPGGGWIACDEVVDGGEHEHSL
jgi:hypothetical protein